MRKLWALAIRLAAVGAVAVFCSMPWSSACSYQVYGIIALLGITYAAYPQTLAGVRLAMARRGSVRAG